MTDVGLEQRLAALGAALQFPAADALADDVVAAIARRPAAPHRRRVLLVAAAVVLVAAAVVAAVPDSRHAVARWLGLDQLSVHVVAQLPAAAQAELGPPLTMAEASRRAGVVPYVATGLGDPVAVYAPGGRYVAVRYDDGGTAVLVTTLPGALDDVLFRKLVTSGTQVTEVAVGDRAGVWVTAPHVFLYESPTGGVRESRLVADTLAWQVGDVIVRVEGDVALARALEIGRGVTSPDG